MEIQPKRINYAILFTRFLLENIQLRNFVDFKSLLLYDKIYVLK